MTPSPHDVAQVTVNGWTWTTKLVALLNLVVGSGVIAAWIRTRPQSRKIEVEKEEKLRDDLIGRVAKLETDLTLQAARFESERAQHEALIGVMRHRLNNMTMCFDALLLLIETAPEKAADSVVKIKEMRARQVEAETAEKVAIAAASITAKGGATTA